VVGGGGGQKNTSSMESNQEPVVKSVEALKADYSVAVDQLLRISTNIESRIADLARKEQLWCKTEKFMEDNIAKAKTKVKLDVGGKTFHTSKSSLMRFEGSFFWTMIAGGRWEPDDEGFFFIDRNPKHFDRIVDYHRTGEFNVEALDAAARRQLEKDFDFYQLPLPQNWRTAAVTWDSSRCGSNLRLTNDNKTVTKVSGGDGWNAGVLGTEPVESYHVTITSRGACGNLMVGLAPQSGFQINGTNCSTCGYYIRVYNGTLYSGHGQIDQPYCNGKSINNGDRLTVKHNGEQKQISFALNGQDLGVAFHEVPAGLFPAVDFYDEGASVTLE